MNVMRKFSQDTFSNPYYQFIHSFVENEFEDSKVLGKFYTNYAVADNMIEELVNHLSAIRIKQSIKIIDPFCGDGRLIISLLEKIEKSPDNTIKEYNITLWDIDEFAVNKSMETIQAFVNEIDINVNISAKTIDAYVAYAELEGEFDVCVTNPPWGLLKPLKIFNERCTEQEINEYKNAISLYDEYMQNEFYISQPKSKFGKWGTNLGRCGLEVALRLICNDGLCGFVSPASLFNDQVSVSIRKWIFEQHKIYNINYFPAELKLYGKADVSSVTVVAGKGKTNESFVLKLFDSNMHFTTSDVDEVSLNYIKRNVYSIPFVMGVEKLPILICLEKLPTVMEYCVRNNLTFVRELDETKVSEKLKTKGKIIFAKGYMVDRYSFIPDYLFLNEEIVIPPASVYRTKLVWRDVSRNTQKRRIKATILQPNCIVGNSLGAIVTKDEDSTKLKILLAIMNSIVFEFQARGQLVSNHVSAGIIKQIHIPDLDLDSELLTLVERKLMGEDVETQIEIYIAKMYGLTEQQFMDIISSFNFSDLEMREFSEAWIIYK